MLSKIFKSVSPVTTIRGRNIRERNLGTAEENNKREISDIIREHILPTIPHTLVGADLFFRLCNEGSTNTISAVDTVQFYRREREATQVPLTYALICSIVAEQREQSPADAQDLRQLGRARDIYETIRAQKDLLQDIDEGLERGIRNEFVADAATAARMTKRFWEEREVPQRIAASLPTEPKTLLSTMQLILYVGGRISRKDSQRLSIAYTVRESLALKYVVLHR